MSSEYTDKTKIELIEEIENLKAKLLNKNSSSTTKKEAIKLSKHNRFEYALNNIETGAWC